MLKIGQEADGPLLQESKTMSILKRRIIIFFLLACFFLQSFISLSSKSATYDEVQYYGMGKYLLLNHKWDVMGSIMHPPLSFYINSFQLLFFEEDSKPWQYEENTARDVAFLADVDALRGQQLLSAPQNVNDRLLILSRLMTLLLSLLLGYYIYRFSSELNGMQGGIVSLFLFTFCPNMLAFSGIITPDMPLTVFSFIAVYYFWSFLKAPNNKTTLFASVSLGLALSAKFTALLLIPFELLMYAVYLAKEKKKVTSHIFTLIGFAIFVFVLSYQFNPIPFIQGNEHRLSQVGEGFSAFFHGNHSIHGWWYFYPAVFFLKTPVPVLLLFAVAAVLYPKYRRDSWFDALVLFVPVVSLFTLFISSGIATGVRYLLPVYPFIFVIIGGLAQYGNRFRYLFYAMAVWYIAASLFIAPHYLAYFNELIGGSGNGYKYLVDSNLDWGQDLKGLKKYMDANGIKRISLSYFGIDSPKRYGINYDWLPSHFLYNPNPEASVDSTKNRFVAISATNLQGVYLEPNRDMYKWLMQYEPVTKIGYSIFVYDLRKLGMDTR